MRTAPRSLCLGAFRRFGVRRRLGWLALGGFALAAIAACQPRNRGPALPEPTPPPAPPASAAPPPLERVLVQEADATGIALYPEELDQIRQTAAMFLATQPRRPLSVVPDSELAPLRASVASASARCRAPAGWEPALRAAYPGVPEARILADCHARPCKLSLRVERAPEGDGAWALLAQWEASVEQPESLVAWISAVGRLTPAPASGAGALLGMAADSPRPLVQIVGVSTWGLWSKDPDLASFAPLQAALDACHAPGWSSAGTDRAVVGIGPDGLTTRCHVASQRDPDSSARLSCLCRALEQLPIPPGPPDRRLELRLSNRPSSTVALPDADVGASIDALQATPGWQPRQALSEAMPAVARCYAETQPTGPRLIDVELAVEPDGFVIGASVLAGDGAEKLASCIGGTLRGLGLPCTPGGAATTVRARLRAYTVPRRMAEPAAPAPPAATPAR